MCLKIDEHDLLVSLRPPLIVLLAYQILHLRTDPASVSQMYFRSGKIIIEDIPVAYDPSGQSRAAIAQRVVARMPARPTSSTSDGRDDLRIFIRKKRLVFYVGKHAVYE
jgi:hypothetical protein